MGGLLEGLLLTVGVGVGVVVAILREDSLFVRQIPRDKEQAQIDYTTLNI